MYFFVYMSNMNNNKKQTTFKKLYFLNVVFVVIINFVFSNSFANTINYQTKRLNKKNKTDLVIVGGDHNYPPYEFLDENGNPTGYNTELTMAIAKVMGLKVEVNLAPWSVVRERLNNGEIDILQGMSYSEQRDANYDFVPHHATVNQSLFARKGSSYPTNFSELKNKEVIVQKGGFTYDQMIDRNIGANLIEVSTHIDALRLLSSGKHDFAIVANLPGLYVGKELQLTNIQSGGKPFASMRYGYSVIEGNDTIYAQFSEGLAILKRTGKQQEIYDKWLGSLEKKGLNWKVISFISAGLLATLLLIIGMTITWNRQLSQTINRRTKKLQSQQQQLIQADKMASLGVLVSGVAHEINNPTGLLLLNTPVIKESYQDIESILEQHYEKSGDFIMGGLKYSRMRQEIPKMLDDMLDRANRIRRIVNDLRDYSQQSSPELNQNIHLNSLVSTAIRIVKRTIERSTNNFNYILAPNLPLIHGNAQRIEQVLINIIINACQSLTSSDQKLQILTFYDKKEDAICLELIDTGCGIEKKKISRITEPFFTTKRESGGTGLGLSVSSSIIEEHKGKMIFESIVGEGTTVTLKFPAFAGNE